MCLWRNIRDLDDIFTSVIVKQEGKVRYEERIPDFFSLLIAAKGEFLWPQSKTSGMQYGEKKKELRIKIYTVAFHIKWPCRETTEQTYNIIQLPRWTATYFITLKYIPVFKNVVNLNIILNKYIYIFPFLIKKRLEHKNYVYLVHGFILQRFWKRLYIYISIFFFSLTYSNKNLPRRELLDLSDIIGAVNDDSLSCVAVEYI